MQPMVSLKNAAQEGRKLAPGIAPLYRGLGVSIGSEVASFPPVWCASIARGRNRQFCLNPGGSCLQMNIASMAPITATQFGATRVVQTALTGESGQASDVVRVASAFVGGGTSALVATPFEMIVIHQQVVGRGRSTACQPRMRVHACMRIGHACRRGPDNMPDASRESYRHVAESQVLTGSLGVVASPVAVPPSLPNQLAITSRAGYDRTQTS